MRRLPQVGFRHCKLLKDLSYNLGNKDLSEVLFGDLGIRSEIVFIHQVIQFLSTEMDGKRRRALRLFTEFRRGLRGAVRARAELAGQVRGSRKGSGVAGPRAKS